ncbi:UDP-N-acetylmuramoyl-L-alanine--D-glutamate ligase [Kordiimonas aestuarii]|uniref:UDP-N-acetylmuramoyl-L-alanine--D-glutamate ligase n=1 Tax=Kordiimonas aestuarii TaxID=1005925 RepID=UPI0021D2305A|nr:UDP-N-acetylmuramoyl-L-alanine--D-glutamate ligase [Kordiimonas aestuarii]
MITASAYKGKKIGVFGLARTGVAAVRALEASGADVQAWDDADERRAAVPSSLHNLYDADFSELDAVMLAPGVPLTHPEPHALVKKCTATGTPIISDFDVFEAARNDLALHKVVAITGTNGKSTTTALIGHMVAACGRPAAIGGNIGTGILALEPLADDGVYVLEMSSFQLDLTKDFNADIAILLNITPDHLDRHGDVAGYVRAKKRLFDMQAASSVAIISVDDDHGAAMASSVRGRTVPISVEAAVPGGVYVLNGELFDDLDGKAISCGDLLAHAPMLLGGHNWQNMAAAYAAGRILGLTGANILKAFGSFPGLAHRQETLAFIRGVRLVNDSKATNVDAASRALKAFENIHWIAGGRPKEKNFSALLPLMGDVKQAYLIGEAADAIAHDVGAAVGVTDCRDLEHALELAFANAVDGDVILLSPACTAFDQFRDFEARGEAFRTLVKAIEESTV